MSHTIKELLIDSLAEGAINLQEYQDACIAIDQCTDNLAALAQIAKKLLGIEF